MQAQTINSNWAGNKYRPASGMIPRKQETLKGPVTLARIGHSLKDGKAQNHNDNLGSPWWMSVGSMEYLWSIARNTNTSLATIVRQKCCIPYYWNSACDLVYEVELSGLADCWIGPGTFFFPEKDAKNSHLASTDIWPQNDVTFFPAGEFPQIFIPGLWDQNVKDRAWSKRTVMTVLDLDLATSYFGAKRIVI